MSVIQIMVTIIIVTILVTVVLGAGSYVAYRLRQARRPVEQPDHLPGPRFFYRYVPSDRPSTEVREVSAAEPTSGSSGPTDQESAG